ncbi:hypothetical protein QL285_002476 [Trifolium repens]|nr:hypothetical protein QL285_002476 [Trifolium repens]
MAFHQSSPITLQSSPNAITSSLTDDQFGQFTTRLSIDTSQFQPFFSHSHHSQVFILGISQIQQHTSFYHRLEQVLYINYNAIVHTFLEVFKVITGIWFRWDIFG